MPEEAPNQKLNRAKKAACEILAKAGYKIEKTSNQIFCVQAMRAAEWRVIAIGITEFVDCHWFLQQIKALEKLPADSVFIQKEVWIRQSGEHNFNLYFWKANKWVNEDLDPIAKFN